MTRHRTRRPASAKETAIRSALGGGLVGVLAFLVASPAWAQYSINRYTIDGGGVTQAAGGAYSIGATIGQPDAGFLAGGVYSLSGGFWLGGRPASGIEDGEPGNHGVTPDGVPLVFQLHVPAPNPVERQTDIVFDLPAAQLARLRVYDTAGRLVRTLEEGPLPAGRHRRTWDGTDNAGRRVAAGIYLVRLETETMQAREKVVVL